MPTPQSTLEAALKPARLWMAVYAVDYRDARAGREREVAERVQRRLRVHKLALLALAACFGLVVWGTFAVDLWMWIRGARSFTAPLTSTLIQGGAPIAFAYAIVRSHRSANEALQGLLSGVAASESSDLPAVAQH